MKRKASKSNLGLIAGLGLGLLAVYYFFGRKPSGKGGGSGSGDGIFYLPGASANTSNSAAPKAVEAAAEASSSEWTPQERADFLKKVELKTFAEEYTKAFSATGNLAAANAAGIAAVKEFRQRMANIGVTFYF